MSMSTSRSQPERGPYYLASCPFLGLVAAVTCGNESERTAFWDSGNDSTGEETRVFCMDRYGATKRQETMFQECRLANVRPNKPIPTGDLIERVVAELVLELAGPRAGEVGSPAALDEELVFTYPTIAALYRAHVEGAPAPAKWRAAAVREFKAQPKMIW